MGKIHAIFIYRDVGFWGVFKLIKIDKALRDAVRFRTMIDGALGFLLTLKFDAFVLFSNKNCQFFSFLWKSTFCQLPFVLMLPIGPE